MKRLDFVGMGKVLHRGTAMSRFWMQNSQKTIDYDKAKE